VTFIAVRLTVDPVLVLPSFSGKARAPLMNSLTDAEHLPCGSHRCAHLSLFVQSCSDMILFVCGSTDVRTQDLMLARQTVY
jgi:hypothetical protein